MPSDLLAQGRDVHRSRRPLDCADRIQLLLHAIAMQVGSCLEVEFAVMQKLGGSGLTDPFSRGIAGIALIGIVATCGVPSFDTRSLVRD